ncbi:MAG TPA: DUF2911 domain-containing protein [Gemmatimonas sp.]|nr:DUF2911 domain-containing protein [Gemmatimonas sp.]
MVFRPALFSLAFAAALGSAAGSALEAQGAMAPGAMRPAPSGRGTTEVALSFVDTAAARAAGKASVIRIDYGQPHLRGRTLFTETLVPYDKPWRLGANGATTLTTDVDLMIGGQRVAKGSYVLQAMPSRTGWKLLVQKPLPAGAEADAAYDPKNDLARIDLRVTTLATPLESFSMWLVPSTADGAAKGELRFAWGSVALATDWAMR